MGVIDNEKLQGPRTLWRGGGGGGHQVTHQKAQI
jgi:hypothetical protein